MSILEQLNLRLALASKGRQAARCAYLVAGVLLFFSTVTPGVMASTYTYAYSGNQFNAFFGGDPDTSADFITASFTYANPLVIGSPLPISWTISDQVTTLSSGAGDNSFGGGGPIANASGQIVAWYFEAQSGTAVCGLSSPCLAYPILFFTHNYPTPASPNNYDASQIWCGGSVPCEQASVSGAPGTWTVTYNNFQGGSSSTPVPLLTGVPAAEITGTIVGQGSQDYYSFLWNGGAFSASASITGANAGGSYLFSEGVAGSCSSGGTATLDSSDSFTSTISIANLAAGQYCIGLDANSANDPAFALTFNTAQPAQTPEPSGFVLLSIGLGMISVLRLTKRRRATA